MNISCLNERLSSASSIVLSLWFSFSGLAAIIGNAVVLWLLYKNEALRTISNRFLASLCVADFAVGLVIEPTWIAIRCFIQPAEINILNSVLDMLWIHTTAATVFNLCCVSVDRFIAIRFPFRYEHIMNKNRCCIAIIIVWLTSLFLPFSKILSVLNSVNEPTLWLSLTFITFVLPITVVTLCYFWIFKVAREKSRRETVQNTENRFHAVQNYKAVKTIGFVLGVFVISWIPCLVLSVVQYAYVTGSDKCVGHKLSFIVWPWFEAIAFTSSAINPWIYCFRNSEFRETLRRNFQWCLRFDSRVTPEVTLELNRNQRLPNIGVVAS